MLSIRHLKGSVCLFNLGFFNTLQSHCIFTEIAIPLVHFWTQTESRWLPQSTDLEENL